MPRKSFFKHVHNAVVPSRDNGHHPHLLKREVVVAVLSFAVLLEMLVLTDGFLFLRQAGNMASVLPGVVASLTNQERADNHLTTLTQNPLLAEAASLKAKDMAEKGYFSHTSPDGALPWKWLNQVGYTYEYAGENLAVNFVDSDEVVDAWMNSPTHKANILKQNFTEIGVGMAKGEYKGEETIFVVQFFGKPSAVPTKASATRGNGSAVSADTLMTTGEVLGISTESIPLVDHFIGSPMTMSKYVFVALGVLFVLVFLIGVFFGRRLPRLAATIGVLLILAMMFGLVAFNKSAFLGDVEVIEEPAP